LSEAGLYRLFARIAARALGMVRGFVLRISGGWRRARSALKSDTMAALQAPRRDVRGSGVQK